MSCSALADGSRHNMWVYDYVTYTVVYVGCARGLKNAA